MNLPYLPESFQNILICRSDSLGDVVLSLPVIEALKIKFPQDELVFLGQAKLKELIQREAAVRFIAKEDSLNKRELAEKIKKENFGLVIHLFSDYRISWATYLAGIPFRLGPASKLWQFLYNIRINQHRSRNARHEAQYNLDLLAPLGAALNLQPRIKASQEEIEKTKQMLKEMGLERDSLIVIHPGSKGSALNWSLESYSELALNLLGKDNCEVLFSFGPGEDILKEKVKNLTKGRVKIFQNENGLSSLIGLLACSRLFISGSTGPMHIAAALNCKTLSFFAPLKACSPKRWGPLGNQSKILIPALPLCQKCKPSGCPYYNCMNQISVQEAEQAVSEILN